MENKNTLDRYKLQLILSMVIFGTIGLIRRFIPYSSALVAFVRGVVGVLFLLIIHVARKEKFDKAAIKKNIVKLIVSGALIGLNWVFLFEAYRYTTIAAATICYYMAPVFVIIASPIVVDEKMTTKKAICSIFAVIGMVLVSGVIKSGFHGLTGVLYGLLAALMYATVIFLNKKITDVEAKDRTVVQLFIAAVAVLPYMLLTEDFGNFEAAALPVIMLIVAGIINTGIAYSLYFGSLYKVPAQSAAILSYIDPVVAVLLSTFVLKEGMDILALIGVVLVIVSAAVSEIKLKGEKD